VHTKTKIHVCWKRSLGGVVCALSLFLGGMACQPALPEEAPSVPSETARIKFKSVKRLANNLSVALGLPKSALCKELGTYDCFSKDAHSVTLGGVEPYVQRINNPWKLPPLSAPIAVDRVALASCQARVKQDFADANKALIFAPLVGVSNPNEGARREVVVTLYKRFFLRLPTNEQASKWVGFWDTVTSSSQQPAQDWATLVCFGIASSTEFLFY